MWFLQPNLSFLDVIARIVAVLTIIFLILPLHECAHGWMAYKLGDDTAKRSGRMTLNPLAHFDPIGALSILLFNFGWAKPVPVNPRNFKNPRKDNALTALAGPISNLLAAIAGGLILNFILLFFNPAANELFYWVYSFLSYYIIMNVGLAVFNLLPVPPLDGSKIFEAFIPSKFINKYYSKQYLFSLTIIILLFFGLFNRPLSLMQTYLYNFIVNITYLPFSIFR